MPEIERLAEEMRRANAAAAAAHRDTATAAEEAMNLLPPALAIGTRVLDLVTGEEGKICACGTAHVIIQPARR